MMQSRKLPALRGSLFVLPFLLVPVAGPVAADGEGRLELDQPAPAKKEIVQVAGNCESAGETVRFSFEQKNKSREYDASVTTNDNAEYRANIHLAHVQAESGPATLKATCSGGKTAETDFRVGVRVATAGAATSVAAETDEAATGKDKYRGRGHNADRLRIDSKTPPRVGGEIGIRGMCPSEDGNVAFSIEQGDKSYELQRSAVIGPASFRKIVKLDADGLKPGPAKVIALCPGGKLLTQKITLE